MTIERTSDLNRGGQRQRPPVIGLTGPIAAGKSTVANRLRQWGADVVDADAVYRLLLVPGSDLVRQVADRFGPEVIEPSGHIDRVALGDLVFADAAALADLDLITHPAVTNEIRALIDRSTAPVIAIEAVKLVQSGLGADVDVLWFVTADEETRLKRLMARPGMDEMKARARIRSSPDLVPIGVRVDLLIDTTGDIDAMRRTVDDALQTLTSNPTEVRHDYIASAAEESS
jgi:dephospho-CoA kinase